MARSQRARMPVAAIVVVLFASPVFSAVPVEYRDKYDLGYESGYPVGYDSGLISGKKRGTSEGDARGRSDGYQSGWDKAYQPAFDAAYAYNFPIGHEHGWDAGLVDGFADGYTWAEDILQIGNTNSPDGGSGFESAASVIMSGGYTGPTSLAPHYPDDYDWAAHYFDEGYDASRGAGFSAGDIEGFDLTYPAAYAAAFPLGERYGWNQGTLYGRSAGRTAGFDDGWSAGYGLGFDDGFYAGAQYRVWGDFDTPVYQSVAAAVPEPASIILCFVALVPVMRSRRERVGLQRPLPLRLV